MATLPTPEENARMVLTIFESFDARPGSGLRANNFAARAASSGLRIEDINAGVAHGLAVGWFEGDLAGSVKLTEAGFAEI